MNDLIDTGLTSDLNEVSRITPRRLKVYSPPALTVKNGLLAGILLPALVAWTGCASEKATVEHQTPWVTGVRYSSERVRLNSDVSYHDQLESDFLLFSELGIDTVMPVHVSSGDEPVVHQAAMDAELKLVLNDSNVQRLIRSGHSVSAEALRESLDLAKPARVALYDLGRHDSTDAAIRDCVRTLQTVDPTVSAVVESQKANTRMLTPVGTGEPIAMIPLSFNRLDPEQDHRNWLLRYHEALSLGATGGVLFSGWQEPPGSLVGPGDSSPPLTPQQKTLLKSLVRQAGAWSSRLHNAKIMQTNDTFSPFEIRHPKTGTALFKRNTRLYAMIFNSSTEIYLRSEVTILADAFATPLKRAVEVAGDTNSLGGTVIQNHQNQLVIPVDLSPGEGVLYELF